MNGGAIGQASLTKILALELSDVHAQSASQSATSQHGRQSDRRRSERAASASAQMSVVAPPPTKTNRLMYGFNESDVNTTVLFALGKSAFAKRNQTGPVAVQWPRTAFAQESVVFTGVLGGVSPSPILTQVGRVLLTLKAGKKF